MSPRFIALPALLFAIAFALSACGTVTYERARLDGLKVSNPSFGRGVAYQLPPGYALLNPYAPVPAKLENADFETYLRGVVASNDSPNPRYAFRETLLYRSDDRYVVVFHIAMNLPWTFRSLPPEQRALLLPDLANECRRYFNVSSKDGHDEFVEREGRTVIMHEPFRLGGANEAGRDWIGTGYGVIGDVTDIVALFAFARSEEVTEAKADLEQIMAGFRYGPVKAP